MGFSVQVGTLRSVYLMPAFFCVLLKSNVQSEDVMIYAAGFVKTSTVDFPCKLAAVLFLPGCGFRCNYCLNANLSGGDTGQAHDDSVINEFFEYLTVNKKLLDGVVISGGDPLFTEEGAEDGRVTQDVVDLVSQIREVNKDFAIKIDTTGVYEIPDRLLYGESAVNYWAIDYSSYVLGNCYRSFRQDKSAQERDTTLGEEWVDNLILLSKSSCDFEIRTTIHKKFMSEQKLADMAKFITELRDQKLYRSPVWYWQQFVTVESFISFRYDELKQCENYSDDELVSIGNRISKEFNVDIKYRNLLEEREENNER